VGGNGEGKRGQNRRREGRQMDGWQDIYNVKKRFLLKINTFFYFC